MSLLWGTDWHLNFLKRDDAAFRFAKCLAEENPDADGLVLTGDISSGEVLEKHLTQLSQGFLKPIYFVLGNHSYYHSSFQKTDDLVTGLTKRFDNLHWLNEGSCSYKGMSIVGVNGWYDCKYGNSRTRVEIMDFTAIEDLWGGLNYRDLMIELVRKKATKEAERLDALLFEEICNVDADTVLIATHVPPYMQAAWHEGSNTDREWIPWFASATIGEVIDKYAENHTEKKFIVLCGHGHSPGIYERRSNLVVYTGGTKNMGNKLYGRPDVVGWIHPDTKKIRTYNKDGNLGTFDW